MRRRIPHHRQPIRYQRVPPRGQGRKLPITSRLLTLAVTPLLGSRLVFPHRFDRLVAELAAGGAGADLDPSFAHWYFGDRLRIWVDPAALQDRISDVVNAEGRLRWVGSSFLDAADWSQALTPVNRSPIHREVSELVAADLDYRATRAYQVLQHSADAGRPVRRNGRALRTVEQIDGYFRYCIDLIESMRANGVVPRRQFRVAGWDWFKHRRARPTILDSAERDVGVAIDRDGRLIRHLGGKHRTAIAQALQLPTIPVELRMVHVGWLGDQMRRTGLPAHAALRKWLQAVQRHGFPGPA